MMYSVPEGNSAREEIRTPTGVTPLASETSASTNFATRAVPVKKEYKNWDAK
jgi:hypothetical protein